YAGIDSRVLLRQVIERLQVEGFAPANADMTIVAQRPRLAPYIDAMRDCLAADLQIERQRVNIKATTTEGMGFTGRGEGIAAMAAVLLQEQPLE
ncbi:MAG: 2-C-methyl-D-erythritol 2,4-cyclodiphosphate synthase, partial [Candidatus Thiodiazotropha sp. (ex Codakia orbicularis)]|nr:2-C-methyl-D-erythritol 2,4-cyclodiphosphate synthase [Candidatus Thiodiazotropha sp. (ex Codakia orbicularis)]